MTKNIKDSYPFLEKINSEKIIKDNDISDLIKNFEQGGIELMIEAYEEG